MSKQTEKQKPTERAVGIDGQPSAYLPPVSRRFLTGVHGAMGIFWFGALRVRQNHSASANLQNQQNKGVGGWGWERVFRYWVFFQRGVSSAARYAQPTVHFNNNPMNVSAMPRVEPAVTPRVCRPPPSPSPCGKRFGSGGGQNPVEGVPAQGASRIPQPSRGGAGRAGPGGVLLAPTKGETAVSFRANPAEV